MSDTPTPDHQLPRTHYLNATYGSGIRSWLLTTDHKRIALLYLGSVTVFFFIAGVLQQALHHARRGHDFLLPDPVDPRCARKFSDSADDRCEGSRLSEDQSS